MDQIRLRYSGIVNFLSYLLKLITGLLFIILVTRNLTITEFGQWQILGSLMVYGVFPASLLGYWYFRYTARGIAVAKSGLLLTSLFTLGGIFIYFVVAKIFISEFDSLILIIIAGAFQIITTSLNSNLSEIARGKKPEIIGYSLLIFEFVKVGIALLVVYLFDLSVVYAVMIIVGAQTVQLASLLFFTRSELSKDVDFKNLKQIIKTLWLPIYSNLPNLLYFSDILIVGLFTSSFALIATFKVAFIFTNILEHGRQLVLPLGTKLLINVKDSDILVTIKLTFTFSIPLAVGIFILAKPLLFLLNPEYASSELILQILLLYSFTIIISQIFESILGGTERADYKENFTYKDLLHSNLFKLPSLNLLRTIFYLVGVIILTILYSTNRLEESEFGILWAIVLVVTNIPVLIYKIFITRRKIKFSIPWKNIMNYCFSASIMAVSLIYLKQFLTYPIKITEFAPELIGISVVGMLIYFGILVIIDRDNRDLFKDGFQLVKKIK